MKRWVLRAAGAWDRFWFTPADPTVLGLIRIAAGGMLFYTHLAWGMAFGDFFGEHPWITAELARELQGNDPAVWSHFWFVPPAALWTVHLLALAAFLLLTLGLFTRFAAIASAAFALSYAHRAFGALFGLDQINILLALYLAVGPSGDAWSLDRWFAIRRGGSRELRCSVGANLAVRLIQLHMCVIYAFAGMAKLQGPAWWSGVAFWGAAANLEYQSLDITWLAHYPLLVAVLTHTTIFWELYYPALIWPRFSRPIMLAAAVPLHLGIACCMGMMTFGVIMLVGNAAFVRPAWLPGWLRDPCLARGAVAPAQARSRRSVARGRSTVAST